MKAVVRWSETTHTTDRVWKRDTQQWAEEQTSKAANRWQKVWEMKLVVEDVCKDYRWMRRETTFPLTDS